MKLLFAIFMTLVSTTAYAGTRAIFSADGSKATILLISMTAGDTDAANLYAALTIPEEVIDGKRTKRFNFDNAAGSRAFSLVCVLSAFVAANGTCTVIVQASANSSIDRGSLTARMSVTDPVDLAKIVSAFVIPAHNDLVFATADGHLSVTSAHAQGTIHLFEVNYR